MMYHYSYYSCEYLCLNVAHHPETPYLSLKYHWRRRLDLWRITCHLGTIECKVDNVYTRLTSLM